MSWSASTSRGQIPLKDKDSVRVSGRCISRCTCFLILFFMPDRGATWHTLQMFINPNSNTAFRCLTFFTWFGFKTFSRQEMAPFNPRPPPPPLFLKQASVNTGRRRRQTGWKFLSSQILFLSAFQESNQRIMGREEEKGKEDFLKPLQSSWIFTRTKEREQKSKAQIAFLCTQRNLRHEKKSVDWHFNSLYYSFL